MTQSDVNSFASRSDLNVASHVWIISTSLHRQMLMLNAFFSWGGSIISKVLLTNDKVILPSLAPNENMQLD